MWDSFPFEISHLLKYFQQERRNDKIQPGVKLTLKDNFDIFLSEDHPNRLEDQNGW